MHDPLREEQNKECKAASLIDVIIKVLVMIEECVQCLLFNKVQMS